MAVERQIYRDAMARLGAAVNVITTDGPAGRWGFTASAVCSVTDDPPTLLVCMRRAGDLNERFKTNAQLCVNVLTAGQEELSAAFAGQSQASDDVTTRFARASWNTLVTGAPVLHGAVASFDCRIAQVTEVGTHSVLFCEVQAIQLGTVHECLIYFARAYHKIGRAA